MISYKSKSELGKDMKYKVVIHEAEEGGYWAEVPALPGCFFHRARQKKRSRLISERPLRSIWRASKKTLKPWKRQTQLFHWKCRVLA